MISINTKITVDENDNYKEAINAIKKLSSNGITKVIITKVTNGKNEILNINETKEVVNILNDICDKERIFIDLYPGSLIKASYTGIDEYLNGLSGTLNDSPYVLIDIGEELDTEVFETINEFIIGKKVPVISNPELNLELQRNPKRVKELAELGCLFQLNIKSLNGDLGKGAKKVAKYLRKKNLYDFLEAGRSTDLTKLSKDERLNFRDKGYRLINGRFLSNHKFSFQNNGFFQIFKKEAKDSSSI